MLNAPISGGLEFWHTIPHRPLMVSPHCGFHSPPLATPAAPLHTSPCLPALRVMALARLVNSSLTSHVTRIALFPHTCVGMHRNVATYLLPVTLHRRFWSAFPRYLLMAFVVRILAWHLPDIVARHPVPVTAPLFSGTFSCMLVLHVLPLSSWTLAQWWRGLFFLLATHAASRAYSYAATFILWIGVALMQFRACKCPAILVLRLCALRLSRFCVRTACTAFVAARCTRPPVVLFRRYCTRGSVVSHSHSGLLYSGLSFISPCSAALLLLLPSVLSSFLLLLRLGAGHRSWTLLCLSVPSLAHHRFSQILFCWG